MSCTTTVAATDLAYLAGLLDGEGTIAVERRWVGGRYKSPRYTMKVEIQMSDRPPIDHIATLFPRNVMVKKPTANAIKTAYRISWQSNLAAQLLETVFPYLILKQPQALVALEFQRYVVASRQVGIPLTAEEVEKRDHYYHRLRELKR